MSQISTSSLSNFNFPSSVQSAAPCNHVTVHLIQSRSVVLQMKESIDWMYSGEAIGVSVLLGFAFVPTFTYVYFMRTCKACGIHTGLAESLFDEEHPTLQADHLLLRFQRTSVALRAVCTALWWCIYTAKMKGRAYSQGPRGGRRGRRMSRGRRGGTQGGSAQA